ncbi:DUF6338 family protein [Salinigranum halophilum]|uniref:DUF6338 family protein n=1 Tax=Salinigranum halophilum TaxID=2565931 RepID=UPI00115CB504|nr:DUF6338 family protein [Salinigranum halophilum]
MQLDLLGQLLGGELLFLLALLPGFIATQLFIWQSGVRVREGTLERVAWSLGVGVVSAPFLLVVAPLLVAGIPIPPVVRVAGGVLLYGLVLGVAALVGLTLGQRYREEFHERYDAHPSLETAWAFLHLRTPRGFARVRTKSGEEFVGQVRFVGKALPNDDIDARDILLSSPRRLDVTDESPAIPYATRLGEYLYLTGSDIHRLHVDADLRYPSDTSVLAWLVDILTDEEDESDEGCDDGERDASETGRADAGDAAAPPSEPHVVVGPDPPTLVEQEGGRAAEVTVTNDGDAAARAVEVHVRLVDDAGLLRGMSHRAFDELVPGASQRFRLTFAGESRASLRPVVDVTLRSTLQILAPPTLSQEGEWWCATATVRNVSGHHVRYGELVVRFYTADGTSLGRARGYVEDVRIGDQARIRVPTRVSGGGTVTHCRYGIGRVWTASSASS